MFKKALMIIPLLASTLTATVIEVTIEEKTQKPLSLTSSQINRIAVTDGSVSTIIGNPTLFTIQIDENLGQALITLKKPIETPEGLTVISDSGAAQDFLVTSQEGEPTVVYLTSPLETSEIPQRSLATIDTLFAIFEEKAPEGFNKREFYPDETLEVGPFLSSIESVSVYEGALENLYVVFVKNNNRSSLYFDKKHFETKQVNWVFCPTAELKKNQETCIVISRRKD